MNKLKRLAADVSEAKHERIKIASVKDKFEIADAIREFFDAYLRGDPRAKQIVEEAKQKK